MSWHKIKPFMDKLLEHEAQLAQQRKDEADERARRLQEYEAKVAEKMRKRAEKEKAVAAEEEYD